MAALQFAGVRGEAVLCPSNTFMATPLAILAAGGRPVFVDCNRDDLCASLRDFEAKLHRHRPEGRRSSCTSAATSRSRCRRSRTCAPPRASS